jgi:hypothetical protein
LQKSFYYCHQILKQLCKFLNAKFSVPQQFAQKTFAQRSVTRYGQGFFGTVAFVAHPDVAASLANNQITHLFEAFYGLAAGDDR